MQLRSSRPMRQIYLDASNAAASLSMKAESVASQTKDPSDKLKANDIAFAAMRFSRRSQNAADTILTLVNDGTLRAYCEQFDKVFKQFADDAAGWEVDLEQIEKSASEVCQDSTNPSNSES